MFSLHSYDSWPSSDEVGRFFVDFELFRTASGPSRRVRETAFMKMASSRDRAAAMASARRQRRAVRTRHRLAPMAWRTTRTCAEHRVDGVPRTTETLVGSRRRRRRHRRDRGPSDTPRRPRRGPKQLKIEKETTPDIVRWPRVASKAPQHLKTPRAHVVVASCGVFFITRFQQFDGRQMQFQSPNALFHIIDKDRVARR